MKSYLAHKPIELLQGAMELSGLPVEMRSLLSGRIERMRSVFLRNLFAPAVFYCSIRRRRNRKILVREFLTTPIGLWSWLLFSRRRDLYFVINHNIQNAHTRWRDQVSMRLLLSLGFRFVAMESIAGIREIGVRLARDQIVQLPYAIESAQSQREGSAVGKTDDELTVGFIGRFRFDKAQEEAIAFLLKEKASGTFGSNILVGNPDPKVIEEYRQRGCITLLTKGFDEYLAAIRKCDVVVLNYRKEYYFYRPSGVVVDVVSQYVPVVCPDFPVIREQLNTPVQVGATYESLDELNAALRDAHNLKKHRIENFRAYVSYRSAENISALIKSQIGFDDKT